ncbi:MAG: outer membrane protein assembly factor BamA [Bernardetiaceae bacterium]
MTFQKPIIKLILLIGLAVCSLLHAQAQIGLGFNNRRPKTDNTLTVDYSNPKEYEIGGIEIKGIDYLDPIAIIGISGLRVGDKIRVPGDQISQAVRKLWKQGLLGNVSIEIDRIEGEKIFLNYVLSERPRLSRFVFEGVKKGQAKKLTQAVDLIRGRIINDVMIKGAEMAVKRYYREKGYGNVSVRSIQHNDSTMTNYAYLTFLVDRGPKVKVGELIFEGNENFSDAKLNRKMKKTNAVGLRNLLRSKKFLESEYANDKEDLIAFYNRNGYRDAEITFDTIYALDPSRLAVRVEIKEGRQYFYRNITWKGNYIYTDDVLSRVLNIKRGDVYNAEELNKRLSFNPNGMDISSLYMDDGYLFFNVTPAEVRIEGDSIDVEMRVFEGEQATINKIIIEGNTLTSDHVIQRELRTIPGQKFSRSDLIRTQQMLSQMGYFDPEQINISPEPNISDGTVDIRYSLVEKPNDQIELSGGWGGFFGFVGTLGLTLNNFSLDKFSRFKLWPIPKGDGQSLQLRFQANGRRFQTYTFTFTEPWLGGKKRNSFSFNLQHSVQRLFANSGGFFPGAGLGGGFGGGFGGGVGPGGIGGFGGGLFGEQIGNLKVYGATFSLGRQLNWPDDYFSLSNSISYLNYRLNNFNAGFRGIANGNFHNFVFNTTLARSNVDSPIYPRNGSQMTLSVGLTPPYSLLGRGTEFNSVEQELSMVEYHKWMFDNSWFMPIIGDLVLNVRAHFGYVGRYNSKATLVPFERFIMGGSGLTFGNFLLGTDIISLRGYDDNSVTPNETRQEGGAIYNKFVLELRHPVTLGQAASIYVLAFAEGGNTWNDGQLFNPFDVKRSAGVGARIFMPAFGLLGVDWGYGFDQIPGALGASGQQFHFMIGQTIR